MLARLLLIGLLTFSAWAQEDPVEIDLIDLSSREARQGKVWTAPALVCTLCKRSKLAGRCHCQLPLTQELAEEMLDEIREILAKLSSDTIRFRHALSVRAVSSSILFKKGGEKLLGLYEDDVIWLSLDLNRRQAFAVLAHELGHAWFFQKRKEVSSPDELFFEGFAEFVSYLALEQVGDRDACHRIEHSDQSVYGRGARKFLRHYREKGLAETLKLGCEESRI